MTYLVLFVQEGMHKNEYVDANGCVYEGKASRLPWGNSTVKMNVGITKNQFKQEYDNLVNRCAEISKWYNLTDTTRVRNAADALSLLTSDHWHSTRTQGYSNFHHSLVEPNDIGIADYDDAQMFGFTLGDPFILFNKLLKSGYKGDDGPMKNWPTICKSKTTAGIFAFLWKDGNLAHSRYSNICTLTSGEGVHSRTVKNAVLNQLSDLSKLPNVVFWSWIDGCWICIPHAHLAGFDWPFECTIGSLLG